MFLSDLQKRDGFILPRNIQRWLVTTLKFLRPCKNRKQLYKGKADEVIAVREIKQGKYLVVVYKEVSEEDGFIVTAFLTKRIEQIRRREKLWPR